MLLFLSLKLYYYPVQHLMKNNYLENSVVWYTKQKNVTLVKPIVDKMIKL